MFSKGLSAPWGQQPASSQFFTERKGYLARVHPPVKIGEVSDYNFEALTRYTGDLRLLQSNTLETRRDRRSWGEPGEIGLIIFQPFRTQPTI